LCKYYFGKGKAKESMVGLSIGTGLGAGIIINNKLHAGHNYGAGEFGMVDYLEHNYEYYASGQFFKNVYGVSGNKVFELAKNGDSAAKKMFDEFGYHLGNAIKMILYTYDPSCIILGGSVSQSFSFFRQAMWQQIKTFAYQRSLYKLTIEVSELDNCGVWGAAALANISV
jgi:glucokinase